MEIHSKRGLWYVIEPGQDKRIFDTEAAAVAYTKGSVENEPDDEDLDDDEYWEAECSCGCGPRSECTCGPDCKECDCADE